ncbi:MAG: DM13 domain-containing protein [Haloferacaceae archaeon]
MNRRTLLGAVGGATLLGGGYGAYELFAPERATRVEEETTRSGDGAPTVLKSGTFTGKDGHRCSGTVELARDGDGLLLRFIEYDQTQGPDVFCYLTPAEDPDTAEAVDAGRKVLIDGGADGGEMTKTGTFTQRLSDGVDPAGTNGVAIWCDAFSVPFGAATLTEPGT